MKGEISVRHACCLLFKFILSNRSSFILIVRTLYIYIIDGNRLIPHYKWDLFGNNKVTAVASARSIAANNNN